MWKEIKFPLRWPGCKARAHLLSTAVAVLGTSERNKTLSTITRCGELGGESQE